MTGPGDDPSRAADSVGFARRLERLTSSSPRPWEHVGNLLDLAHTSAITGVLRSFGPNVARVDPIGIELTATLDEDPGGWQRASLIAVDDEATAGAELEGQGWTVVETRVQMEAAGRPVGVVVFSLRVTRH